jgi:hypothetical protein
VERGAQRLRNLPQRNHSKRFFHREIPEPHSHVFDMVACVLMVTFVDMESKLNADVGQPAPDLAMRKMTWRFEFRDVDSETYELTSLRRTRATTLISLARKTSKSLGGVFYAAHHQPAADFNKSDS